MNTPREELSEETVDEYEHLIDEMLGDPSLVTEDKATVLEDGSFFGGIEFERTMRFLGIVLRCYGLGATFQIPRQMSAPVAGSKLYELDADRHLRMSRDLLRVRVLNLSDSLGVLTCSSPARCKVFDAEHSEGSSRPA
jgi:hypothetical protein